MGVQFGREQQMLAVARALMTNPMLLRSTSRSRLAPIIVEELVRSLKNLAAWRPSSSSSTPASRSS